jgi:hypothetical protein
MKLDSSYLKKQTSLAAVRRRYNFASCDPSFKADWERLLAKRKAGDELWVVKPPKGAIEVRGIALVRKDRVISTLVEAVG